MVKKRRKTGGLEGLMDGRTKTIVPLAVAATVTPARRGAATFDNRRRSPLLERTI